MSACFPTHSDIAGDGPTLYCHWSSYYTTAAKLTTVSLDTAYVTFERINIYIIPIFKNWNKIVNIMLMRLNLEGR